jgi:phosphoribosylformimino-5-aminoimidazole carboxamide ribotide isomerase
VLIQQFDVIPAVDVLEGRVVRLSQGRREAVTIEGGDPVELARRLAGEGWPRLHLVDLDGAFAGQPSLELLERVASAADVPLQVGGGYRTRDDIAAAFDAGAERVMIGTAALAPGLLQDVVARHGSGIVVAVDARAGRVAVDGWTRESALTATELADRCAAVGVARLLVTSTTRDGSLAGPDVDLLRSVLPAGIPVLAAGGIASVADLRLLRDIGCEGAVCGSALLSSRFTRAEALAALAGSDADA